MKVAYLESFYSGSHRAVADDWRANSAHDIELHTLPGRHWKWRMHGGAWQLGQKLVASDSLPDVIFATSLLDVASLRGLMPAHLHRIPIVLYMHENQFVYPQTSNEPDWRFAFLNLTSAIAADAVWFNSDWNRRSFFAGVRAMLKIMPDGVHAMLDGLQDKSRVAYPGINVSPIDHKKTGPLRIL